MTAIQTVTIHRREYSLWNEDESYRAAFWIEYAFEARTGWDDHRMFRSEAEYLHRWDSLPPVEVSVPSGARLVERTPEPVKGRKDLPPETRLAWPSRPSDPGDEYGLCAHVIHYLASRRERGFAIVAAKKRRDEGPSLFGSATEAEPAPPLVGAYGAAKRGTAPDPPTFSGSWTAFVPMPSDPMSAESAFSTSGAAIDQVEQLRTGIARALDQLRRAIDGDEPARIVTARAILEGLIEAPARAGAGAA